MKISSDGLSEFTMAQIQAKSAALGLSDSLTTQVMAMASDADFSAKAATGKLTWNKALRDSKIGADDLIDALGKLDNINLNKLDEIKNFDGSDLNKKNKLISLVSQIDGLGDSIIDLGSAGTEVGLSISNVFKGIGASLKPLLPLIGAVAAGFALFEGFKFLDDKYTLTFGTAQKHLQESSSAYSSTVSELSSMNAELETSNARIDELKSKGTLTLAEEAELAKLERANTLLETQIKIKEQLADSQAQEAAKASKDSIDYKSEQVVMTDDNGAAILDKSGNEKKVNVDRKEYVRRQIEALEKEQSLLDKANNKFSTAKEKKDKDLWQKQIDSSTKNISSYKTSISNMLDELNKEAENFYTDNGSVVSGYEKDVEALNNLNDAFNNIDLSPAEKALKNLDSFFSDSSGTSAIKKQLEDAFKSGKDLELELSRMGLTLGDLGIDSISQLSSYFQDAAKSAQDAKKSVQDYSATVSDVETASSSANQDSDWSTIQGAYKTAKELLKEGKTGTDDFQSMASFLNPKAIKAEADKNGEYIADAYQKAFEEAQKYADRWFDEDQTKSMENFVNDFKKKGLFDVSTDSNGLWDIDTKFKTTAEAAEGFGMSVQSIETMLHSLEAYGYDFSNITFSTDGLTRYETALNGIKQIQKELSDGSSAKKRLDKLLPGWESEYNTISDDLSKLSEPQIIQIEFEYSLAQIQQEIDKLQQLANEGGDSQTWAELNANKKSYRDKSESRDGNEITSVEEYKQTSDTIIALQDQLRKATTDSQKETIQSQISNLYDLQNAMNDAFADSGKSFDEFKANNQGLFDNLLASSEEAKQAIADLLGVDVEDIKINVDADTSKAKEKLDGVLSQGDNTIVMEVDASTSEIQAAIDSLKEGQTVVFSADVDGVKQGISAVKNEDGTISYIADVDGVQYYVDQVKNEDGTINYTLGEHPTAVPDAKQIVNREANNAGVSTDPPDVGQGVNRKPKNPPGIFNNLKSITQSVIRTIFTKDGGKANLAGTAHLSGTVHRNFNSKRSYADGSLDDTSWIKDSWKTKKDEYALTGEKAPEIVAHGNQWWTVGEKGAEFSYIPSNSVVFNAEQSKQLLEKGYITSRGTAHLSGTAYRLGSGSSSGSSGSSSKTKKKTTTKKNTTKKSSSSKSSAEKATEEVLDWIETLLKRVARQTEIAVDAIDSAIGLVNKQTATSKAISKTQDEIAQNQKAKDAYLKKANSLGLSSDYTNKIKNGTLNIETITNEDLKKKISDYKEWLETSAT